MYLEKFKTEAKRARSEASEYMNKLSNLTKYDLIFPFVVYFQLSATFASVMF